MDCEQYIKLSLNEIDSMFEKPPTTKGIEEIIDMIKDVKIHLHSLPGVIKSKYNVELKIRETRLSELKCSFLSIPQCQNDESSHTCQNNMNVVNVAQNQKDSLQESLSILYECENIGTGILGNLQKQREQIEKIDNNTNRINHELSYSNSLLNKLKSIWR